MLEWILVWLFLILLEQAEAEMGTEMALEELILARLSIKNFETAKNKGIH